MHHITLKSYVRLILIQTFIFSLIYLNAWISTYLFKSSKSDDANQTSIKTINEPTIAYSTRAPIIVNCSKSYKVAFTFDDGPHPIYTPLIIRTLHRHRIKAGFFILGTSMQSFLGTHENLTAHIFERPRLGSLLIQDYSLIENLLDGPRYLSSRMVT